MVHNTAGFTLEDLRVVNRPLDQVIFSSNSSSLNSDWLLPLWVSPTNLACDRCLLKGETCEASSEFGVRCQSCLKDKQPCLLAVDMSRIITYLNASRVQSESSALGKCFLHFFI